MIRRSALFTRLVPGLVGALLSGASALAQDAGPPPDSAPPQGQPAAMAAPPPADAPPADQTPPLTPVVPPPAPVVAQSLQTLDLFSAGSDAGLGADFWKGSSAALARTVIPTLADKPMSPATVVLARRVLANGAAAPDGAGTDVDLAAARARVLLALGDAPGVEAIVERTPNLAASAALSQIAAEAALITDQPDRACRIGDALLDGRDSLYWLRLRTYCQVRQGKGPEAQLTLTLAEQQGADADYVRLMSVVMAGGGNPGAASLRDGLDYALSRQLQLDLAPALAGAPPAIAEHVRVSLPPPAPAAPPAPPQAAPGDAAAPPPAGPSEADVLAALRAAQGLPDYLAAAKAQVPAIDALVQAKAVLANPVQLATAAVAAGDLASAEAIRAGLVQDTIPGASRTDLAILDATLAAAADQPDPQTLDTLVERGAAAGEARARAQAAAALFANVAGPASPSARVAIAGFDLGHANIGPGALLSLELAADARAPGDVALLVLALAQADGVTGPSVADRAQMVRALARVGLPKRARAYAVEGLIPLQSR